MNYKETENLIRPIMGNMNELKSTLSQEMEVQKLLAAQVNPNKHLNNV